VTEVHESIAAEYAAARATLSITRLSTNGKPGIAETDIVGLVGEFGATWGRAADFVVGTE
jgi:hypothetical protein